MIREKGRPADEGGRLEKEISTYDFLDRLGIPYDRVDHQPAETMEVCKGINEVLDMKICKNLFLCNRQKTNYYLLMIPGDKVFKTKELSHQIGSARLSFGTPEAMEEMLDVTPGSATIMGLMNDTEKKVRLLIDREVLEEEYMGCHPCVNTASLRLRTSDVLYKFLPYVKHEYRAVQLREE